MATNWMGRLGFNRAGQRCDGNGDVVGFEGFTNLLPPPEAVPEEVDGDETTPVPNVDMQPRPIDEPALTDVVYFTRFTDCVGLLQLLDPDAWPQPTEVDRDAR